MPRWPLRFKANPLTVLIFLTVVFFVAGAGHDAARIRHNDATGNFFGAVCISAVITLVWWVFSSRQPG